MADDDSSDGGSGAAVLARLYAAIAARRGGDPSASYTASLFAAGRSRIARKVGEEAIETVIAGLGRDRKALAAESADLLYHLLVLWADAGLKPADVFAELARREGTSGLVEKARRSRRAAHGNTARTDRRRAPRTEK
jgi:phosphoribosyl-ATP pyrophosphohydrolase